MKKIMRSLCILLVALFGINAGLVSAFDTLQEEGEILQINSKFINVSDSYYPLLSAVKVQLSKKSKGSVSNLKKGDLVRLMLLKIDKKYYVDSIWLISQQTQNEEGELNDEK